ncbi:polyprenyl diphosphate synthase [Rhodopila sp.]|jgi:undecaprenyl diphosphate synthase|uniref:polyprenyl diphosphate synthase n=1 Tax=Rhodopila sp. TaxID=2480087 RepID=UPI002C8FB9F5|nr:polyprenyl diphosphate synthase [Rhodopila sp.]HVZ07831.1 polyprenyl diphosphate synthase [Rhodopila sp.]
MPVIAQPAVAVTDAVESRRPVAASVSTPVPAHVAIIMDGNGRWAASRGLPRVAGHREGAQAVRRTVESAIRNGVGWLTIYAFSSENWRRPHSEIVDLTGLLRRYLKSEIRELDKNGVRLRFIGDRQRFDPDIQADLAKAERETQGNKRLNLTIALSYGARAEIAAAARAAAAAVKAGQLDPAALVEDVFEGFLHTAGTPDPDLIIRTSGEKRLSNFLLWQAAYAELIFLDVLWPDFNDSHFTAALAEFGRRERRFGARSA